MFFLNLIVMNPSIHNHKSIFHNPFGINIWINEREKSPACVTNKKLHDFSFLNDIQIDLSL